MNKNKLLVVLIAVLIVSIFLLGFTVFKISQEKNKNNILKLVSDAKNSLVDIVK